MTTATRDYQPYADPKPRLTPEALYFGDNGRITCGALRCAGMTPHYSGRDLSGQKMKRVTERDAAGFRQMGLTAKCETCGAAHGVEVEP